MEAAVVAFGNAEDIVGRGNGGNDKRILAALCLCAASATIAHGETLGYGSRAGREVTVVSKSNIGTSHATINVKHTKANAVAYCRDYVGKVTPRCVSDELKVPLAASISANCKPGNSAR